MPWELFFIVGTTILMIALIYGYWRTRSRDPIEKEVTEQATHEMHHHPEQYTEEERHRLERMAS